MSGQSPYEKPHGQTLRSFAVHSQGEKKRQNRPEFDLSDSPFSFDDFYIKRGFLGARNICGHGCHEIAANPPMLLWRGVFNLNDVLQFVVYRLDQRPFSQQNFYRVDASTSSSFPYEQVSHRLSYLVGGIILEEMLRPNSCTKKKKQRSCVESKKRTNFAAHFKYCTPM